MTTNVSIEYNVAQQKYESAKTPEEKLAALQEMYTHAPSHKAAEKLRKEITKKIGKVREEVEKEKVKKSGAGGGGQSVTVKKDGDAQIVIVGAPNTGKSTLLKLLTNSDVLIAPYAFSTTKPELGMLSIGSAKIQMVEIPALIEGASEGKANGTQHLAIIRNADALILILNSHDEFDLIKKECLVANIKINETKPKITIKNSDFPGIHLTGQQFLQVPEEKLIEFLKSYGKQNSDVFLEEPTTLEKVLEVLNESIV
ncbi:MAG: GTPase, partial [Candidatus Diapherotrites archaeon]|nr:GTPase [Candidatus Diapherotrites archaeon]